MQRITATLFLLLFIVNAQSIRAQEGYYIYEEKGEDTWESLELKGDGTFTYVNHGEWSVNTTKGVWTVRGKNSVMLNSEYQLSDYALTESVKESLENKIYLTIQAPSYDRGPKKIESIIINDNPSLNCQMRQDIILAEAEKRNEIMTRGTQSKRDSLMNSYQPAPYECNVEGMNELQTVRIEFDKKHIDFSPKKEGTNVFNVEMRLAPGQNYRYFKDEVFLVEKRALVTKSDRKFKKSRQK